MKRSLCAVALATVATIALPLPAAQADLTCNEGDLLHYIAPPLPGESFRQPLLRYDKDGDRQICVHEGLKKNGDSRLTYYDDI